MVLEELASELMGLELQLRHQVAPSGARPIRHGPRHGVSRRGVGRRPRSDTWDRGRFRIGRGWVSLQSKKFRAGLPHLQPPKEWRVGRALFLRARHPRSVVQ
jgi:hypothetical protein